MKEHDAITCPLAPTFQFQQNCPLEKCAHHSRLVENHCLRLHSSDDLEMTLEEAAHYKGVSVERARTEIARAQVLAAQLLTLQQFVVWIDDNLPRTVHGVVPKRWPFTVKELGIREYNVRHVTNRETWNVFARGKQLPVTHQEALSNQEME